jgi:hypothetical protein
MIMYNYVYVPELEITYIVYWAVRYSRRNNKYLC